MPHKTKVERATYMRQWRKRNRAKVKAYKETPEALERKRRERLQEYGLTPEEYDKMLTQQQGVCAICQKPPKGRRLDVDHCHTSGRVRGLLCITCKTHLEYLETYRSQMLDYLEAQHG